MFTRVAKLRPADRQLWIERVHFLARNARWPEAAKAMARVLELDPEDHLTWHLQAALQLQVGDLDGYRRDCRDMLARFGKTKNGTEAERIAAACLLAPQGTEDVPAILTLLEAVPSAYKFMFWNGVTLGRGHYRQGHFAQAAEVLARVPHNNDFTTSAALACLAMCQQKQNQPDAARQSLQQARDTMARLARPGPGALQDNWYDWVHCQVILREAEILIPSAPAVAGTSGSTAQDYAAQRDRKARAEKLSTQAALSQLRFDAGQHKEAETELRAVLSERGQIAAEEPANPDYQVDLAATRFRLAQFLADSGRPGEALKESGEALAFLETLSAQHPKNLRFRTEAASGVQAIADMHAKADQPNNAVKAWKKAIKILSAALNENPDNRAVGAALAAAEEKLANYYGALTLWSQTGELLARAVRRPGGGADAWRWLRAGQAALAAGNVVEVRKLAAEAFDRFRNATDPYQLIALAELMALTDGSKEILNHISRLAEQSAREQPKAQYLSILVGVYEYRSGQFEQAVQRLETPELRGNVWSKAFLAMAHHRLGNAEEARDWLDKAAAVYNAGLRSRVDRPVTGTGPTWWDALNQLVFYREAHELITGKPLVLDPLERLCLARAYAKLGEPARADAEFKAAIETRPNDPIVWLARSRAFAEAGRQADAAADRARGIQLTEQALAKSPDDAAAADTLAALLLRPTEPKWTLLKPTAVKSQAGTTLTVLNDASVLAGGARPDREVYIIEAEATGHIGAVRLEVIPDPRMPKGGSGRGPGGNFILTDFRVTAEETMVAWARAVADFSQINHAVAFAIDADESSGWAIYPRVAEHHWAVFIPKRPFGSAGKTKLTIRLACQEQKWLRESLGRFRLSVAGESDAIQHAGWFIAASTPHAKVGAAYVALGDFRRAVDFLTKATAAHTKSRAADWLVLALAHGRLAENDKAKKACRKAAELLKPAGADPALRPLLREVILALGMSTPEATDLIAAAAGEVPAALNDAIKQNPDQAQGYGNRGEWYAERGLWQAASADFAEALRLEPAPYLALYLGALLVQTGQIDRYQDLCRTVLARWGSTEHSLAARIAMKACLSHPDAKADAGQLARWAELGAIGDKNDGWYDWFLCDKGLCHYRAGRYADALTACRESRRRAPNNTVAPQALTALNLIVEAMALFRSGDEMGAKRTMAKAKPHLALHVPGIDGEWWWSNWLLAHVLYREAEALVQGKKAPPSGR